MLRRRLFRNWFRGAESLNAWNDNPPMNLGPLQRQRSRFTMCVSNRWWPINHGQSNIWGAASWRDHAFHKRGPFSTYLATFLRSKCRENSYIFSAVTLQQSNIATETSCFQPETYGGFLKWWYPQNTPKWSFLVGNPWLWGTTILGSPHIYIQGTF